MPDMSRLFEGKRALVFGVANERSIAWGISQALHEQGARLGFTYLGEALERRVRPLAESVGSDLIVPCDVGEDAQIDDVFTAVRDQWGGLDVLIHSIAYAPREDLEGRFSDTTRNGFLTAMEISAYSLVALTRAAARLMPDGGSVLTMTYFGSEKVVPGYNVMGVAKAALEASVRYLAADLGPSNIRVNAISAGPIKTLAAAGVKGLRSMLTIVEEKAPLKRNVTQGDVASTALYLCSELGRGVTGEVVHVDAGYNVMGM
jgi:enoyl-[acyl-carrier protein] reductase I